MLGCNVKKSPYQTVKDKCMENVLSVKNIILEALILIKENNFARKLKILLKTVNNMLTKTTVLFAQVTTLSTKIKDVLFLELK